MTQRMLVRKATPEGYAAVLALDTYVAGQLDPWLYELLRIRASMINGCAYCVDMHSSAALVAGNDVRKVLAASAWRESTLFDDRERSLLALTDEVTRLGEHGVADTTWDTALEQFGERGLADTVLAIATIKVWNRIAVSMTLATPPLAPRG
jgi:AhpD family alkylhydroperoxidase